MRLCSAMTSAWFAFVEAASFERRALNFSSRLRGALVAGAEAVSFELPLMVGLLVVMALVTNFKTPSKKFWRCYLIRFPAVRYTNKIPSNSAMGNSFAPSILFRHDGGICFDDDAGHS